MLTEITSPLLGGIGIFFIAAFLIGRNIRQITCHGMRERIIRYGRRDLLAALLGIFSGLIFHSRSICTCLTAGLVASGLITVRNGLPLAFWSTAGCSLLVIIAGFNLSYLLYSLLVVFAIAMFMEVPYRFRLLLRILSGIILLLFSLEIIRSGGASLLTSPWVRDILSSSLSSSLLLFFLAAVCTALLRTGIWGIIVIIALSESGLFRMEQAMMMIYGVETGSLVRTWLLASGAGDRGRQLVFAQVAVTSLALTTLISLFYFEQLSGVPLVKAMLLALSSSTGWALIALVLLYSFTIALTGSLLANPIHALVNYLRPLKRQGESSTEEGSARLAFIRKQTRFAPAVTLLMIEEELLRLFEQLPNYMRGLGDDILIEGEREEGLHKYHQSFTAVNREIGAALRDLSGEEMNKNTGTRLFRLLNIQELINALERNLLSFAEVAAETGLEGGHETLRRFSSVIKESQEFLLMQAVDALFGNDRDDLTILQIITSDSGDMIKQVRMQYLETEQNLTLGEKSTLHRLAGLFERTAWLLNRLSVAVAVETEEAEEAEGT